MRRINVVGTSGSGKSHVAKILAKKLNLPYIEMDRVFWGPNWHWPSDEEFFIKLKAEISKGSWVLDGNYTRTLHIKWEKIDTVIWVDLPFHTTLFQAVRRAVSRAYSGKEIWPNTGNIETFKKSFFNKDSIILWTIKTYSKNKAKYEAYMKDEKYSHIKFIRLTSHNEIKKFLDGDFNHDFN